MKEALKQAKKAYLADEIPVGALIVKKGQVIAEAFNQKETLGQATKHAEIIAIEKACEKIGSSKLTDCVMYVSLEPCLMCLGAILESRLSKVFFACEQKDFYKKVSTKKVLEKFYPQKNIFEKDEKNEKEASELLKSFFKNKR